MTLRTLVNRIEEYATANSTGGVYVSNHPEQIYNFVPKDKDLSKLILISLGDECTNMPADVYTPFATVYRNYVREV